MQCNFCNRLRVEHRVQRMQIFYRVLDVEGNPRSGRSRINTHIWKILHISHSRTINNAISFNKKR